MMMQQPSMTMLATAFALAACGGSSKKAATTIANTGGGDAVEQPDAAVAGFRDGALWTCQISDYDAQPCKLSRSGGGWRLDKLLGSQRFSGRVVDQGKTLAFEGEFFCPWGECTQAMKVEFEADGNDGYVARFDEAAIHLRYDDAVDSEYGGAGYGGLTGREQ